MSENKIFGFTHKEIKRQIGSRGDSILPKSPPIS